MAIIRGLAEVKYDLGFTPSILVYTDYEVLKTLLVEVGSGTNGRMANW